MSNKDETQRRGLFVPVSVLFFFLGALWTGCLGTGITLLAVGHHAGVFLIGAGFLLTVWSLIGVLTELNA